MILTKKAILQYIDSGHIVSPRELVQENSVNVRLGREMWQSDEPTRIKPGTGLARGSDRPAELEHCIINVHGPRAFSRTDITSSGLFILHPGRVYIGTTADAHGTRLLGDGVAFVPELRARSTTGRHGLTVALCAGVGDVGYSGRWALEIVNNNRNPIAIAPGTEIGQVVYHTATETYPEDGYGGADRYQKAGGAIQFLPKSFALPEVQ